MLGVYFWPKNTSFKKLVIHQCFGSTTILQAFPDIRVSKADSKSDMLNWWDTISLGLTLPSATRASQASQVCEQRVSLNSIFKMVIFPDILLKNIDNTSPEKSFCHGRCEEWGFWKLCHWGSRQLWVPFCADQLGLVQLPFAKTWNTGSPEHWLH